MKGKTDWKYENIANLNITHKGNWLKINVRNPKNKAMRQCGFL